MRVASRGGSFLLLLAAGCFPKPNLTTIDLAAVGRLEPGMTTDRVVGVMGPPTSRELVNAVALPAGLTKGKQELYEWTELLGDGLARVLTATFVDGRLTELRVAETER